MLSMFLCVAMILTMVPMGVFAAATKELSTFTVEKNIIIDDEEYTIKVEVGYPADAIKTIYTVEFESNGGSEVQSQFIIDGEIAVEPDVPIKNNYKFCGWYTDNESFENRFDFSSRITKDLKLYAKWEIIVEGVTTASDSSVSVYSISKLVIDTERNTATATVSAPENCAVIVRFIEEDIYFADGFAENKTYINGGNTYASHIVAAGSNMTTVSATISHLLPERFVAEAILIDSEGNALCDPYASIVNTERYEEYDAKSVYDFPEENLVLNFDADLDDNFGVLADDVKIITAEDVTACDSDQDGKEDSYKIINPSEEINAADKIFISDDDSDYLFKVLQIDFDGTVITVIPAKADDDEYGFDMEEFYKFLKVDMEYDINEEESDQEQQTRAATVFSARASRGINVKNVYRDVSGEINFNVPLSFETDHFAASVKAGATIKASLVFEWDIVLFGEDYMRCDFTCEVDANAELEVKGKWGTENNEEREELLKNLKEEKTLSLGKFRIPFGVTGLDAFADVKVCVQWKITAGIKAEGHIKTISGYKYNTVDGIQKIDKKETTWSVQCEGHAEVKFGPEPSVGVEFLDGVLSCELECFMGAKFEAEALVPIAQGGDYIHGCHLCIDGKLSACITVDAKLKYKITEHLKGTPIDLNIVSTEKKLFDFYISLINDPDSIYGGHVKFGFDSCENMMYKTRVYTYDAQGNAVSAQVNIYDADSNELIQTIRDDESVYLPPKTYIAKATINNVNVEERFTVTDGAKTISLTENSSDATESTVSGSACDALTMEPISGVDVRIYENSTCVAHTTTGEDGSFNLQLGQGTYSIELSKPNYITVKQSFSIRENESKVLGAVSLVLKNQDSIMGGIYGSIKDALTGQVVSDVSIKISKGWSTEASADSADSECVAEEKTDANGEYSHRKKTVMGVDFGLDAGNYTVTISKEGYISTTFNVTIVGGQDMEFNSSITPIGAENVYHIVLTWGLQPRDLDSHLNATYQDSRDHIYYSDKYGYYANLDVDDTTSYGPETITIEDITKYSGDIMYSVHDYTNRYSDSSTGLATSGAVVKVYRGGRLLETYYVPSDKQGTVWNVFYIDSNGNIHAVNTFESISDPNRVFGSSQAS